MRVRCRYIILHNDLTISKLPKGNILVWYISLKPSLAETAEGRFARSFAISAHVGLGGVHLLISPFPIPGRACSRKVACFFGVMQRKVDFGVLAQTPARPGKRDGTDHADKDNDCRGCGVVSGGRGGKGGHLPMGLGKPKRPLSGKN